MIRLNLTLFYLSYVFSFPNLSAAQESRQILWSFKVDYTENKEVILFAIANILPGWHLYSQQTQEVGPLPTTFSFEKNESYVLIGRPKERGNVEKFNADLYDTDIIGYSNQVTFVQKVKLIQTVSVIKGTIEYMISNDRVCMPFKQEFSINIYPSKKMP